MDKQAVVLVLEEIAALLETRGENRFKARAFRTAARTVDKLTVDLRGAVASGALRNEKGIGPATASIIEDLVVTGESDYLQDLRGRAPVGMRDLMRVPGLGAKKIAQLHEELGVADLDALEAAARGGRIAELKGFGQRTEAAILAGIPFARGASGRRRYHHAGDTAVRMAGFMAANPGIGRVEVAGELRRSLEIVQGIVMVAECLAPAGDVVDSVKRTPGLRWDDAQPAGRDTDAPVVTGRLGDGFVVMVRLCAPDRFAITLLESTGSAAHLQALAAVAAEQGVAFRDGRLLRDGAPLDTPTEQDVYAALGLQYVPPELRESGDEVGLAARGKLPTLIEAADLRGCFHCHTTASDGRGTLEEMAEGALALGWRYLGISDHSQNAGYAGGLGVDAVLRQQRQIADWNRRRGGELFLFSGIEADILSDGQLDYAGQGRGDLLDAMDFVIGSVHSQFRMDRRTMTARIRRAVSDPRLTFLGHTTGRLLLIRDGYDVDVDAVIDAAVAAGAGIEINADPHRLDLSWQHWPKARERGVRTAINPDAHSVAGLRNVVYGVNIARKAWLTRDDVVNAWPLEDVQAWFEERRRRAAEA